jgi:hypothetical protein
MKVIMLFVTLINVILAYLVIVRIHEQIVNGNATSDNFMLLVAVAASFLACVFGVREVIGWHRT